MSIVRTRDANSFLASEKKSGPCGRFFSWTDDILRPSRPGSAPAILTPMLPHSGIVCRAACAGTWRFEG